MKNNVKHNLKNKNIILILIGIVLVIIFIFVKNDYKNKNFGNNMSSKSIEEIEEYILNISSYDAEIEVTVKSNKNINKYMLKQIYEKNKMSKQIMLEPSNIEGLETSYENGSLTISNTKLNLKTVYENYNYLVENCLWLDSFIQDYAENKKTNNTSITQQDKTIILETKTRNENNKYIYYKTLSIDKETGKPTKLLIQDINKKNLVYILYNEISVKG